MIQFPYLHKKIHQRYRCNLENLHRKSTLGKCILQNYKVIQYSGSYCPVSMCLKQLDNEKNMAEMKIVMIKLNLTI